MRASLVATEALTLFRDDSEPNDERELRELKEFSTLFFELSFTFIGINFRDRQSQNTFRNLEV